MKVYILMEWCPVASITRMKVKDPQLLRRPVGIRRVPKDFRNSSRERYPSDKKSIICVYSPVWFSFKGNIAVHLSTGKAAAICSHRGVEGQGTERHCRTAALLGCRQESFRTVHDLWEAKLSAALYGTARRNGRRDTRRYAVPISMKMLPYWPQFNTATYKEVWGSSAARWLMLVSEF